MKSGTCRDQDTVHTYLVDFKNQWPGIKISDIDLEDYSCLNGWGFGNLAASANDIAKFYYAYFGSEEVITYNTAAKMMEFRYMNDPVFNVSYGLGTMPEYNNPKQDPAKDTYPNYETFEIIGHAGADWGSGA